MKTQKKSQQTFLSKYFGGGSVKSTNATKKRSAASSNPPKSPRPSVETTEGHDPAEAKRQRVVIDMIEEAEETLPTPTPPPVLPDKFLATSPLRLDPSDEADRRASFRTAVFSAAEGDEDMGNDDAEGPTKYTPLEKQVIEVKEHHPDLVLMVECGYKYRFFGNDAVIAARILGIYAHRSKAFLTASIPVHRLLIHAKRLVSSGYKVGVVKQTETAAIKASGSNKSKPFTRAIDAVYTPSTVAESDEDVSTDLQDVAITQKGGARYLMCIHECSRGSDTQGDKTKLSTVAIDISTGACSYSVFHDDALRSGLLSRLRHIQPVELILPWQGLSRGTSAVCSQWVESEGGKGWDPTQQHEDPEDMKGMKRNSVCIAPLWESLTGTSSWRHKAAEVARLSGEELKEEEVVTYDGPRVEWAPKQAFEAGTMKTVLVDWEQRVTDAAGYEDLKQKHGEALPPLGVALYWLNALGHQASLRCLSFSELGSTTRMHLSGRALADLHILSPPQSSSNIEVSVVLEGMVGDTASSGTGLTGSVASVAAHRGSLLGFLNHTVSPFGYRRLTSIVQSPLLQVQDIADRLAAVAQLAFPSASLEHLARAGKEAWRPRVEEAKTDLALPFKAALESLRGCPDLERSVAKMGAGSYTPMQFLTTMDWFLKLKGTCEPLKQCAVKGELAGSLRSLWKELPDIEHCLEQVKEALDVASITKLAGGAGKQRQFLQARFGFGAKQADRKDVQGSMLVHCFNPSFSSVHYPQLHTLHGQISDIEAGFQEELKAARELLQKPALQYRKLRTGINSEIEYLIELKHAEAKGAVPDSWVKMSTTKDFVRFHTPRVIALLRDLAYARECLEQEASKCWEEWVKAFAAAHRAALMHFVAILAEFDALASLSVTAKNPSFVCPIVTQSSAHIEAKQARHPMAELVLNAQGKTCVPNDVCMHTHKERAMVLTGPNMGGKSTAARMIALLAIMAQIGCFVPAESCSVGVVDAIDTRMGATDDLSAGLSTFMVEMSQTAQMLRQATPRTLLLFDELGRGTSTYDGTAIAVSVLRHLLTSIKCLTVFITHYPELCCLTSKGPAPSLPPDLAANLIEGFTAEDRSAVANYHLGYYDPNDADADAQEERQPIVFLYTLTAGASNYSYGLNVARLAGLPAVVVKDAESQAKIAYE